MSEIKLNRDELVNSLNNIDLLKDEIDKMLSESNITYDVVNKVKNVSTSKQRQALEDVQDGLNNLSREFDNMCEGLYQSIRLFDESEEKLQRELSKDLGYTIPNNISKVNSILLKETEKSSISNISETENNIWSAINLSVESIRDKLKDFGEDAKQWLGELVNTIFESLISFFDSLKKFAAELLEKCKPIGSEFYSFIKDALGIILKPLANKITLYMALFATVINFLLTVGEGTIIPEDIELRSKVNNFLREWVPDKEYYDKCISFIDLGIYFIPLVGDIRDLAECVIGVNLITGEKLSSLERVMSLVGVFLPFVGGAVVCKVLKYGKKIFSKLDDIGKTILKSFDDIAPKVMKNIDNVVGYISKNYDRLMSALKKYLDKFKNAIKDIEVSIRSAAYDAVENATKNMLSFFRNTATTLDDFLSEALAILSLNNGTVALSRVSFFEDIVDNLDGGIKRIVSNGGASTVEHATEGGGKAETGGKLLSVEEYPSEVAVKGYNGSKNFNEVKYDNVVATGKDAFRKTTKWVIPKGYDSVDDFLRKVSDEDLLKMGYASKDEFRETVANLEKYLNKKSRNTIRNQSLAGSKHPVTDTPYDVLGLPTFDEKNKRFQCNLKDSNVIDTDTHQFKDCTRQLKEEINKGEISKSVFTQQQLDDIEAEKEIINGLTWHHDKVTGKMQLVDFDAHSKTGHLGGNNIWGEGIRSNKELQAFNGD